MYTRNYLLFPKFYFSRHTIYDILYTNKFLDFINISDILLTKITLANGPIAQLAEQPAHNRSVPGSNPGGPTKKSIIINFNNNADSVRYMKKQKNVKIPEFC